MFFALKYSRKYAWSLLYGNGMKSRILSIAHLLVFDKNDVNRISA